MDIENKIRALASRIEKQKGSVLTEEACKTAFVMPFLSALGYDVFDPDVVVPEFIADVGVKKGEKVDYAIKINGDVSILVECKGYGKNLSAEHMSQLYRYFSVTKASFAILTNGVDYWFYSDLDDPNKLDQRPFFQFNILEHRPEDIEELRKFSVGLFDVDQILSNASNLKYSSAIKSEILKEFDEPSEEFTRLMVGRVYDGRFTQKVKEEFSPLVSTAIKDAVRDIVNQRLVAALNAGSPSRSVQDDTVQEDQRDALASVDKDSDGIVTTEEEIEAFNIIKAIVRSEINVGRVFLRDAKSYCSIIIDDNNRKPLVRLHFNGKSVKYIGIFDSNKQEEKIKIENVDQIFDLSEKIKKSASEYAGR